MNANERVPTHFNGKIPKKRIESKKSITGKKSVMDFLMLLPKYRLGKNGDILIVQSSTTVTP